jgi:4-hydroxybenzoate polyprenyltransferase
MLHIIKLVRAKNLAMVVATMYAMRYLIAEPMLSYTYAPFFDVSLYLQMSHLHFFLLVAATAFIAAAGYVINDYFDRKIDLLNKPERVVVSTLMPRRQAMLLHWIFNIAGIGLGSYLAFYVGMPNLGFVFAFSAGLLWFYSTNFSREPVIGNVIVSVLTALVPLMVIMFEIPFLYETYRAKMIYTGVSFNRLLWVILSFAAFAFITTMAREIIKDIEDYAGDSASGRETLPIVAGIRWAKLVALFFIFLAAAAAPLWVALYMFSWWSLGYILIFVSLPSLFLAYKLWAAGTPAQYAFASSLQKAVMLTGLLFSFVFYLLVSGILR